MDQSTTRHLVSTYHKTGTVREPMRERELSTYVAWSEGSVWKWEYGAWVDVSGAQWDTVGEWVNE